MCGIAGFITKTNDRSDERAAKLDAMCRVITHRGPDEQGTAIEGRAAMGMRRLSIIDLATGQQPIYNSDDTKLIVFNGEFPHLSEANRSAVSRHAYTLHAVSGRAHYTADNWIQRPPDLKMPFAGFV